MCLNLTRMHPKKDSMAGKLNAAGWNDEFRAELIFGNAEWSMRLPWRLSVSRYGSVSTSGEVP